MPRAKAEELLKRGRILAHSAKARFDLVGLGEMGIGNTTAAAALLSVFSGRSPRETAGYGAGLDDAGLERKIHAIERALALHQPDPADPIGALAAVGGFEIAMMAGFLLGAAEARLPVVLDGFISGSAALAARAIDPGALSSAFLSHRSAERAHELMLLVLEQRAPLDLGMRLGEGTGAAIQMQLLDMAIRLYREMATFEEAGIE
jgi:nicotinate-nucleotide--dimethylbenzimidazole phosphoribosyltransferase